MASTPIAARGVLEQRYSTVSSTTSYQTAGTDTPSATSSVVALGLNGKAATSQTTVMPSEGQIHQQQQQQSQPPQALTAPPPPHVLPPSPPPSIRALSIKDEPIIPDAPMVEDDPAPVIIEPETESQQPNTELDIPPPPMVRALTIDPSSIHRPSHTKAQTQIQTQPQPHASGPSGSSPSALQPPPPPVSFRAPTRRNTTPAGGSTSREGGGGGHSQRGTSKSSIGPGVDMALDDDIMKQAEQIRRERFNKRTKQEAYEASRGKPGSTQADEDERPVVGNIIKEGHVNYVLMYNMLTGIRIAVSRCQAKPKRPLTDEDYLSKHKYSFDIVGNELTPSAKYDFKFKDYAPWIFRDLRETYFHIDPADYLLSLTSKYILSELGSPGKSGSFFYFSRDYKYIIKTIHHTEHKYLLSILKSYHNHVKTNPHTLISRFYGLHRVKLPRGRKIHFVIMNNLFPPHRDIHETYDLKGSTVGRLYPEEKAKDNSKAVLKDLNWINRGKTLEFGKEKRALLTEQLRRDSEWLKSINVMDYSLLIGIHNMQRGNRDNLRSNTLKVFQPNAPTMKHKSRQSQSATALRRAIRQSAPPQSLSLSPTQLLPEPENYPSNEGGTYDTIFYGDEGGFRATADVTDGSGLAGPSLGLGVGQLGHRRASTSTDVVVASSSATQMREMGHKRSSTGDSATIRAPKSSGAGVGGEKELDTIYYLGIIDILTPYTFAKRVEGVWKGLSADRHKISPVPAIEYGDRFLDFLTAIMPGGGGGARFKDE